MTAFEIGKIIDAHGLKDSPELGRAIESAYKQGKEEGFGKGLHARIPINPDDFNTIDYEGIAKVLEALSKFERSVTSNEVSVLLDDTMKPITDAANSDTGTDQE